MCIRDRDKNKKLVIVPEEAEVVKRIYREYLEGNSMLKIKRGLEADGILNGAGNKIWHTSNISKILRNEKYIGDALLQKTYTVDFLTKKRVKNNGLIPQYYVENNHEPIIPKDIYMQVQEELAKRRSPYTSPSGNKRTYSSNHCFANIVICGTCKEIYRRVHWNNRGKKSIVWRCVSRLENTGQFCDARTVHEKDIEESIIKAINNILNKKDCYLPILKNNIASVLNNEKNKELDNIENKLNDLQQKLLSLVPVSYTHLDVYKRQDMYYIRDNHSPIISREDFEATALVLEQRAKEKNITKEDSKYLNRYAFSGKINCKHCGANFRRRTHTSGRHPIAWCCFTHISNIKACPMKYIPDSSFKHAFITMFNKLVFGYEKILIPLYTSLQNFNNEDNLILLEDIEIQLKENHQQRDVLVELLAKNYLDPAIYRESNNKLLQEAKKLQEEKNTLNRMITSSSEELKELNKLLLFLAKADMINNFEDKLFNDFVKDISVFSREEININLKCGLSLKERLVI